MSKMLTALILFIIAMILLPHLALAAEVTSTGLIEKAKELDGQEVVFTGEVIGDIMVRGNYTWINVSDGANAVGVFADNRIMPDITLAGKYGIHGDEVKITGIFRRACPEHGGDLDIHAFTAEVLEKGYPITYEIRPHKFATAAVLFLAAAVLFALLLRKRHMR